MARNPGSSDTTEATSKSGRRGLSLRPLHGPGASPRVPLPDEPRRRPQASAETTTNPPGRGHHAAARWPPWLHRVESYGLALLLVMIGVIMRAALTPLTGPNLSTYITFYPLVMLAALMGGWGPGLLATLATVAVVSYWLLPPAGSFKITGTADAVSLAFFGVMGVFVSIVAELYRRLRDHLEELVLLRTTALSQANEQLQTQAEELANANAALHESEDKFKAIFNRAALGLAVSDSTGLILDCNSAYQEMLGFSKEELQKKHFLDITHPDDIDKNRDLQRQMNEGVIDTYQLEKRYLRRDGQVVWCNLVASAIRNPDGTLKYNMAVVEDVTRRKHAEEALRASEASLAKAQAIAHLANWEVDVRTNIVRGSQELYHLFDLEPDVALDSYIEKFHPEDRQRVVESIRAAIHEGKPYSIDYRIIPRPGVVHWVHAEGGIARDEQGRPRAFFGTVQDITARKEAEAALQESEAKYRRIVETATEGIAMADAEARIVFVNDRWLAIFGYSSEEAAHITVFDIVFPEDVARMKERWESRKRGQEERYEWRYRRKDGRPIWVLASVTPRFGPEGEFLGTLVLNTDITERRQAEEALRENEARLRVALDAGRMGTWVWDLATDTVDTDPLHRRLWDLDDTDGRVPARVILEKIHPADRASAFDRESAPQMRAGLLDLEFRVRRRDGSVRWLQGSAVPIRDADGTLQKVIGVNFDITERKQAEESLRELARTLESKVAERTAQLEHRAQQLQKLTLELSEAEERERERVAQILHDDLQQVLAAAKFHLSRVGSGTAGPEQTQELVGQVKQMLKDAIEKSRDLSHELSPAVLRHGDLAETLDWLAEQMQAKHGLTVRMETFGAVKTLSEVVNALVYRSAQELLFNVVKHAGVNEARIRIRRLGRYICLSVSDRGRGFDPREVKETAGFGLLRIRERVALLGGRMKTRSARGRGTTFRIVVPDAEPPAHGAPVEQESDGRAMADQPL
jgi:PAS domain S-box-containing protein